MKRILGYIAVTALVLGACAKQANDLAVDEATAVKMKHVVFGAEIVNVDATKATIDDAAKFSWENGDKVAVYATDGNFYEFTVGGAGKAASISGDIPATAQVTTVAVYPYSAAKDANTITLPSEYSYEDSKNRVAFPMVAKFEEGFEGTLQFKHITAGLEVPFTKIPSIAEHFVVTTDIDCAGDLDITTGKIVANGSKTIKVPTGPWGSDHFFVPIPAGEVNLDVALNTGAPNPVTVITQSHKTKTTSFTANKIKRMGTIAIPDIPYDPTGYGEGAIVFVTYNEDGSVSIYNPATGAYVGHEGDPEVNPADYAVSITTNSEGKHIISRTNAQGVTEYMYVGDNQNMQPLAWTTDANQAGTFAKTTIGGSEAYTIASMDNHGHTYYVILDSRTNTLVLGQTHAAEGSSHAVIIYVNYPD